MSEDVEYRIAKLELQAGDILVVKVLKPNPPISQLQQLADSLKKMVGNTVRVLVIDGQTEVTVLTSSEAK